VPRWLATWEMADPKSDGKFDATAVAFGGVYLPKQMARRLGLATNVVRAIRSRVAKMIAAVESQYDD